MSHTKRCAAVFTLAMAVTALGGAAEMEATAETKDPCCFTNPRYTGTCQVTPAEDETCASILAYLNNPNSVGQTYCGNTKIRGGWTQVECNGAAVVSSSACTATEDGE